MEKGHLSVLVIFVKRCVLSIAWKLPKLLSSVRFLLCLYSIHFKSEQSDNHEDDFLQINLLTYLSLNLISKFFSPGHSFLERQFTPRREEWTTFNGLRNISNRDSKRKGGIEIYWISDVRLVGSGLPLIDMGVSIMVQA